MTKVLISSVKVSSSPSAIPSMDITTCTQRIGWIIQIKNKFSPVPLLWTAPHDFLCVLALVGSPRTEQSRCCIGRWDRLGSFLYQPPTRNIFPGESPVGPFPRTSCREEQINLFGDGVEALHLPHPFSQVRAFSVWMLRCCCSPRRWVKDEGQWAHRNPFWPECPNLCASISFSLVNLFGQPSHLYGLTPEWVITWRFRFQVPANFLPHMWQSNFPGSSWSLQCFFKLWTVLNSCPQSLLGHRSLKD